jgi:DNA polymerase III subunit epsilon
MRFVCVDVETANPRMSSICQIGVVTFDGGQEVSAEARLVNPHEFFDPYNVAVHGITEDDVRGQPRFRELLPWLTERTSGQVVACHSHFDRVALQQACDRCNGDPLSCTWLDTARVTRRTWSEFSGAGYGLANVAAHLGISFRHHDALEDARAAGLILLRAMEQSGLGPMEWVAKCRSGISSPSCGANVRRDGDGDGSLLGETLVFTGALEVPRSQAADMAHVAGAAVEPGVTKKTTMLVVGDQDLDKLNGHDKSSKHRKAEQLISEGKPIRIVGEADFMAMCVE